MAYAKGQSGNPSGRPKENPQIKALALESAPDAFRKIIKLSHSKDEKVALAACTIIIERACGKPSQSVEISGETRTYVIAVPVKTDMEGIAWESQYNPAQKTLSQ